MQFLVSIISKKVEAAVKDKNTNIIVYCSIGVRSEQIG
jgi:rhodanese-related sulfurtransferase